MPTIMPKLSRSHHDTSNRRYFFINYKCIRKHIRFDKKQLIIDNFTGDCRVICGSMERIDQIKDYETFHIDKTAS